MNDTQSECASRKPSSFVDWINSLGNVPSSVEEELAKKKEVKNICTAEQILSAFYLFEEREENVDPPALLLSFFNTYRGINIK